MLHSLHAGYFYARFFFILISKVLFLWIKHFIADITHCPAIVSPKHGFKQGNDYAVGKMVFFFCRAGFLLAGSSERFCKDTGDWTGNQPVCLRKSNPK